MKKNVKLYLMMALALGTASICQAAGSWGHGYGHSYGYSQGYTYAPYGSNRQEQTRRTYDQCGRPHSCQCCTAEGMVTIYRSSPSEVCLGREFTVTLTAVASADCTDVTIKENMPEGLTYVSSCPPARQEGRELSWDLGNLCCHESRKITITYRAACEGCHQNCYTIVANPVCCQCVRVGCPKLAISKCGTEKTRVCCPVNYRIKVQNVGSMPARDVVVTDYVPEELRHQSRRKQLCWRLGDLQPCETRYINVCFTALTCGVACNTVTAQACGCEPATATASTNIEDCCVSVTKTGPKGPVTVGQDADYKITATNDGNIALSNVRIIDTVPQGTRIKSASGAEISGRKATWTIPSFAAGDTKEFDLTMTSCVHGCLTNQVCAMCEQECGDCDYATTRWVGVPGIWLEVKDSCDPVCVGNGTEYCIVLMNQGYADDTNIQVRVTFSDELKPTKATGASQGKIDGNEVIFDKLPVLRAGQSVTYCISAKAVEAGLGQVKVEASSDLLKDHYIKTESTNVY